jgi:hypothetical protein
MAECQLTAGCIFYNDKMPNKPGTAELMKNRYCRGDFASCARYMVFEKLGRPKVPADLFPGQADKAKSILASQ